MAIIIASTYRIDNLIGKGGGGIVYLGWHLRLNKKVVLKADRRSLSTKPEVLRQEVDALKRLCVTFIAVRRMGFCTAISNLPIS